MSRAGARQIHCEAAIPCDKCNNAVLQYECLATLWHISDLRPRCGVVSARSPAVGGGRVAGESGKVPCDIHGDFSCRVCHTCQSGGLQSSSGIGSSSHGSMTSWPRSKMPDTATDSSTGGPVLGAMRTP